jgi:cytochrome c peroxidase
VRRGALLTATSLLLTGAVAAAAPEARPPLGHDDVAYTFGVGPFVPTFAPPAPGTYELPPIDTLRDHAVLDADGEDTTLGTLIGDRLAVVSFIYGSCAEATGCPISTAALHRLDRLVADDPTLARDVALVTVSFDPARDTPARMAAMRRLHAPATDWQFVTTRDQAMLRPLLDDFGQPIAELRYADGTPTGVFRHVLKVFLVDRAWRVRNVYSVGFLHPQVVLNDLRTLEMAARLSPAAHLR